MSTRSKYYCERVLVRSDDRVTGTAENFSIRFNQSLDGKHKVHWITIPNTLYNVNVSNNRVYTNGAVDYYSLGPGTFEIPHGNYTGTSLAAVVETRLNNVFGGLPISVSFDPTTGKLTTSGQSVVYLFSNTTWAAARVLGYPEGKDTPASDPNVSSYIIFLGCPLSLGIKISACSDTGFITGGGSYTGDTFHSSSNQSSLIVPLVASFTFFNFIGRHDFKQYVKVEKPTKVIGFQLVDSSTGIGVDLNGGLGDALGKS